MQRPQDCGKADAGIRDSSDTESAAFAEEGSRVGRYVGTAKGAGNLRDTRTEGRKVRYADRAVAGGICNCPGDAKLRYLIGNHFDDHGFDQNLRPANIELVDD